ncbi:hypothetical protein QJS10_CPA03g01762 [Acorus calamus]|uniref:Cucumisin n=1 Tax=Acorus calamus TaxID=4465 RepID=A0AAV9F4G9_ACOCL|nr:hypothetical protein QJS10_CPA03g01762 [Acorus calamus]
MGERPAGDFLAESVHTNWLEQVIGSGASQHLIHSYKRSFNGFVASLSADEAQKIKATDGVVSVFPNRINQLHTTRSWSFMGFPPSATHTSLESDIIVGMLDTGAWPESASFNDTGLGAPPSKWKGTCQSPSNFTCNNKIIGARFYNTDGSATTDDILSPRDSEGHGSHTASTVAGATVAGASLYGLAQGTARGAVPSARIAVYKICWSFGCSDADILAAFDDAIADGVDIISLSVGSPFASDYFEDPIAIGAFHAMKRGILTSNSAGNSGPAPSTVSNVSPWSLTVAASSIDRKMVADVMLGNGKTYEGIAVNTFDFGNNTFCDVNSLDKTKVKGKIVLCDAISTAEGPLDAAYPMNPSSNTDAEFAYGAGHINPIKAVNPGLIYDAGEADYVTMLCGQGYNTTKLRLVTGDNSTCSAANNGTALDLNYPSMAVTVVSGKPFSSISYPSELSFKSVGETQSFTVTLSGMTSDKIIGARFYNGGGGRSSDDILSPRDTEGHGSHTASTAAGVTVAGASLYGLAQATAHGAVRSARLAVYKICWSFGCTDADILAAFDDAIADGVDVISLSVGSPFASDYFEDPIAIGAFHAMKQGVLTSKGNSGPGPLTVSNFSPWLLTVAASTIDRKFVADVKLCNQNL